MAILKSILSSTVSQWSFLRSGLACSCQILRKTTLVAWVYFFWRRRIWSEVISVGKEFQWFKRLLTKEHISWAATFLVRRWRIELVLPISDYAEQLMWPRCFATKKVASKCTPRPLTRLLKEISWLPTLKWLSCETLPLLPRSRPSYRWRWQTGICQTNTTQTIQKPCQICQTCHANVKAGCCGPPKAADTLSEVKMDTWPLSALPWRQFLTSRTAVPVLWRARYADWKVSQRLLTNRCLRSWCSTTFSNSLERNGRFDTGL